MRCEKDGDDSRTKEIGIACRLKNVMLLYQAWKDLLNLHPPFKNAPSLPFSLPLASFLRIHHALLLLGPRAARPRCFGMRWSWSRLDRSRSLAIEFLPLVHLLVMVSELILASEAVAFSMVLAFNHRARELCGIGAVLGSGVAADVRPAL